MKFPGVCVLMVVLLASCTPTTSPAATSTPIPATATSAVTATADIPTITVGGLVVPDPKVTNPELFDLKNPDSPIVQFAEAFGVSPEDVPGLDEELRTDVEGNQFIVLTTMDLPSTPNYDESQTPLIILEDAGAKDGTWMKSTLKALGHKTNMPIGSLLELCCVDTLDITRQLEIAEQEFSTTYIGVDWQYREKEQGVLNFGYPDDMLAFAHEHDMMPIAQHLVYTDALPDWVRKGGFDDKQLTALLRKHVHDMMSHYTSIKVWSVVNEPWLRNDQSLDFWYSRLGRDYIEIAFKAARQENRSATLCLSDLQNEVPGARATNNREIIESLKGQDLIDCLMMHMRIDGARPPDKDSMVGMMQSYGIPIYITELTVDLTNVSGSPQDRYMRQAEVYRMMMEAALESGVVKGFNMWGIGDSSNWLELTVGKPKADPTIYTDDLRPKPAYYGLLQAMLDNSGAP